MPEQTPPKVSHRFYDSNVFRPEPVCPMLKAALQYLQRVPWGNYSSRERRIRDNPHEANLGHRTSSPPLFRMLSEPPLGAGMRLVRRPKQRNQHVHIQQKTAHLSSLSNRFTSLDVTRSLSGGTSKTTRPLTARVLTGALRPRRTSSETAFPMA